MKRKLLKSMTLCAACLAWAAQGQNSTDSTGAGGTQNSAGSPTDTAPPSRSSHWQEKLSATGRSSHQDLRGSKLMGADVKTSSGETLGKIEDVVINPASGRIDFAVISYSGGSDNSAASTSAGSTTATATTTTSSGEKLVPLPWSMIRSSGGGYGAASSSAAQPSFVFSGDKSKLESAPSFDRNNWPDFSQSDWNQRIHSSFGSSATGGASSPGGISSGESSTGTSGTSDSTPGTPVPQPGNQDSNSTSPK